MHYTGLNIIFAVYWCLGTVLFLPRLFFIGRLLSGVGVYYLHIVYYLDHFKVWPPVEIKACCSTTSAKNTCIGKILQTNEINLFPSRPTPSTGSTGSKGIAQTYNIRLTHRILNTPPSLVQPPPKNLGPPGRY